MMCRIDLIGCRLECGGIDITNDASVNTAAKELETKYGKIDALINNAGMMVHSAATVADKNLSER